MGLCTSAGVNGADVLRTRHKTKALTLGGCLDPRSATLVVKSKRDNNSGTALVITFHVHCAKRHIL